MSSTMNIIILMIQMTKILSLWKLLDTDDKIYKTLPYTKFLWPHNQQYYKHLSTVKIARNMKEQRGEDVKSNRVYRLQ